MRRSQVLVGLAALTLTAAAVLPAAAQPCGTGWSTTVPITITNPNAIAYTNFEVRIVLDTATLVSAGQMRADGADMRFATTTACLPYTVESGMNTAGTVVWVNVPSIPASGSTTINLWTGNPAAASADDPYATFAFYQGFEGTPTNFTNPCGTLTTTVAGGIGTLSWTSSGLLVSTTSFPQTNVYTAEANVTAISGNWPGLYWALDDANQRSYSLLTYGNTLTIGLSGTGTGWCQGQNFSGSWSFGSAAGLWSLTWVATGDIRGSFPTVGAVSSSDSTWARSANLRLMLGGISSGDGSMSVDWVRARQFAPLAMTTAVGPAQQMASIPALGHAGIAAFLVLLGLAGAVLLARRLG